MNDWAAFLLLGGALAVLVLLGFMFASVPGWLVVVVAAGLVVWYGHREVAP